MRNFSRKSFKSMCLSYNSMIKLVAWYNVLTQLLSVLRATAIYNTAYIANYLRLFVSGVYIVLFFYAFFRSLKIFTFFDVVILAAPFWGLITGYANDQIGRNYFSDFFTAFAFAIVVLHYTRCPQSITKQDLEYLAKWELIATLISLLTYKLFPLIGYPVKSVGIVSNYLLFPLAFYLSYKKKLWIIVAVTILLGGKRGVMLSAVALICFFFIFDKKRSMRGVIAVIIASITVSALLYFTESPERISMLPASLQRVAARFMRVNPFSEYMDLHSDGRLDEIEGAISSFRTNGTNFLLGSGNGFVYGLYHDGVLAYEENHNVHFTPVSLLTRYGIIYMVIFYVKYICLIIKAIKFMKSRSEHSFIMCITLFLVGTFVDQFTTFLPYSDYQFMMCFGILNGFFLYHYDCNEETVYDLKKNKAI